MNIAPGFSILCKCGSSYPTMESLETHFSSYHLNWEPYQCLYCDMTFSGSNQVFDHFIFCHKEESSLGKNAFQYMQDKSMQAELERLKQEAIRNMIERHVVANRRDERRRSFTPCSLPGLDSRPDSCVPQLFEVSPEDEKAQHSINERKFQKLKKNLNEKMSAIEEIEVPAIFSCNLCDEPAYTVDACKIHTWKHLASGNTYPYYCLLCGFKGNKIEIGNHCYKEHKSPQSAKFDEGAVPLYDTMLKMTFPCVPLIVEQEKAKQAEEKAKEEDKLVKEKQEREEKEAVTRKKKEEKKNKEAARTMRLENRGLLTKIKAPRPKQPRSKLVTKKTSLGISSKSKVISKPNAKKSG